MNMLFKCPTLKSIKHICTYLYMLRLCIVALSELTKIGMTCYILHNLVHCPVLLFALSFSLSIVISWFV